MQDSLHSRTLLTQRLQQRQQPGLTLAIESEEDRTHQLDINLSQNKETNSEMGTVDELFCFVANASDYDCVDVARARRTAEDRISKLAATV
ncbi:hypothetical protein TSMEX_011596 [Taenia solium]|eukprot:TsM_000938100 transcript=TsM_000938100 gene=TsM_000938100